MFETDTERIMQLAAYDTSQGSMEQNKIATADISSRSAGCFADGVLF